MKRNTRKTIAEETVCILEKGSYKSPSGALISLTQNLKESKAHTVCYKPEEISALICNEAARKTDQRAEIKVSNQTSLQAAQDLNNQGCEDVVCLNFASAKNPGGGFLGGSEAQEEALCRPSALYASLATQLNTYYEINRNCKNALYTNHIIYSPGVSIFRNEDGELLEKTWNLSFVTSPAPNKGAIEKNSPHLVTEIETIFRQRIESVLAVMVAKGHRNLVLGAWGCGVFRNDPADVSLWFYEALVKNNWQSHFEHICFGVLDHSRDLSIYHAFEKQFSRR